MYNNAYYRAFIYVYIYIQLCAYNARSRKRGKVVTAANRKVGYDGDPPLWRTQRYIDIYVYT